MNKIKFVFVAVALAVLPASVSSATAEENAPEPVAVQQVIEGEVLTPVEVEEIEPVEEVPAPVEADPECAYPCATNQTDPTDPYSNDVCNEWMMPDYGIYADKADNEEFADAMNEKCNIQSEEENQALIDEMCAEWTKPGHGTWGLDPGPIDAEEQEYIDSINGVCGDNDETAPVDEPTDEPTTEPTEDPTAEPTKEVTND
jgi:hypothetical protein